MKPQNTSKWIPFIIGLGIGSALTVAMILYTFNSTPKREEQNSSPTVDRKGKNVYTKPKLDSSVEKKTVVYARKGNQEEEYPHLEEKTEWYDSLKNSLGGNENEADPMVSLSNNENDPVITETIISVKSFQVIQLDKPKAAEEKDSTLEKLNQAKQVVPPKQIEVEYWRSPLNSKGYKAGRKKVALYGFDPEQTIYFFYKIDRLLLYTGKDFYYFLDISPEFKSFKKITDPQTIEDIQIKLN